MTLITMVSVDADVVAYRSRIHGRMVHVSNDDESRRWRSSGSGAGGDRRRKASSGPSTSGPSAPAWSCSVIRTPRVRLTARGLLGGRRDLAALGRRDYSETQRPRCFVVDPTATPPVTGTTAAGSRAGDRRWRRRTWPSQRGSGRGGGSATGGWGAGSGDAPGAGDPAGLEHQVGLLVSGELALDAALGRSAAGELRHVDRHGEGPVQANRA